MGGISKLPKVHTKLKYKHWSKYSLISSLIVVNPLAAPYVCILTRNENGATPVYYAAFSGSAKIVELLIEHGATIDYLAKESEDDTRLRTPLFMACEAGHIDVVRVLIQNEALTSNREASQLFNSLDVAIETENRYKFNCIPEASIN